MLMLSQETKNDIVKSFGSSVFAVSVCSPLEVLKMNAQVTATTSKTSVHRMFKDIYQTHGIKGYYKGLGVSLLAQPGFWAFYFPVYNFIKPKFTKEDGSFELYHKIGCVTAATTVASVIVNPLFVFKTRIQTSVLKKNIDGSLQYPKPSYTEMARNIFLKEGIRGFYKGTFVAQLKNSQMMIQMPLHDYIKNHPSNPLDKSNIIIFDRAFVSGTISKTITSCLLFYPMDVVRTNLRDQVEYKSILQITKEIYKRPGGFLNFYRGVGTYWLSAVPAFGLTMFVYESISVTNFFKK